MELNAKIASLEDEIKLLKGEVKLILSEIRTAILGQDNPFAEPGQALRADPGALESRPPIRVVRVPADDEEPQVPEEPPEALNKVVWPQEIEASEPEPPLAEEPRFEEPTPPPPVASKQPIAEPPPAPAARAPEPAPPPVAAPTPMAIAAPAPAPATPRWSLTTVAGLAIWAEEAIKQIGTERLHTLLDLCEFTGYLSNPVKEALLKVTSLGSATEERDTAPSANECLVVLCQLDALMRGDEPAGLGFHGLAEKWQQPA